MTTVVNDLDVAEIIPVPRSAERVETELATSVLVSQTKTHHHLLDITLQVFGSESEAARSILERAGRSASGTSVFTCNVDHLMLMNKDQDFRDAYEAADVVTIDGAPLALLSKWTGTANASRVTGVDLTMAMVAQAARDGLKVALVGGAEGRAARAAANLCERFPSLPEVFVDSPRMGFVLGDAEDDRLVRALQAYGPDIVVVCLGAPKQELWIHHHRRDLPGAALIGAGATIDFLSGHQARAPRFFQRTGTEAIFRLCTDFKRLWKRYLLRDTRFLLLFATILMSHHVARGRMTGATRSHAGPGASDAAARDQCQACLASGAPRAAA